MSDATRNERHDDSHDEPDRNTDSRLPYRRATQPPQHPGGGRRTDERATSDVIFEHWRARPIASAAKRVAAAESDECQHVPGPHQPNNHSQHDAQRHERALRSGRVRHRLSVTHDENRDERSGLRPRTRNHRDPRGDRAAEREGREALLRRTRPPLPRVQLTSPTEHGQDERSPRHILPRQPHLRRSRGAATTQASRQGSERATTTGGTELCWRTPAGTGCIDDTFESPNVGIIPADKATIFLVRPALIPIDPPPDDPLAPTGQLGPNPTTVTVTFSDGTTTTVEVRYGRFVGYARIDTPDGVTVVEAVSS